MDGELAVRPGVVRRDLDQMPDGAFMTCRIGIARRSGQQRMRVPISGEALDQLVEEPNDRRFSLDLLEQLRDRLMRLARQRLHLEDLLPIGESLLELAAIRVNRCARGEKISLARDRLRFAQKVINARPRESREPVGSKENELAVIGSHGHLAL